MDINDAINQCEYKPTIKQSFAKFLVLNYGSQKHKLYLFSRNESSPKLFLLQLQIPSKFNGESYDISILVYFPINFPEVPPEIFFQKIGKVKINPNCTFYIDEETLKINYELFYPWEKNLESFRGLIAELYNQFNMAFPIFNISKGSDDCKGDCILKLNLCQEVQLIKRTQQNIKSNVQMNNNMNMNQNMSPNSNNLNRNMQKLNINNNSNIINNNNNNNNNNMNNNMNNNNNNNNNMNNNNQNQNDMNINAPYDELKSKAALVSLLVEDLSQKINLARKPIYQTFVKLDNIKVNIEKKLKDFTKIESKSNNIEQTINGLKQDMINTITSPTEPEKIDLSNLDTALIIKNKDYYLRLSKERAIEEYILLIKKSYEKQNMNFDTALNSIRINTRNLFFIKYKNLHPFGE